MLVTQPPGYVLRVPAEAIDARRFETLAAEGQALSGAGRPAAASDVLSLSLRLWRGSAYEDLAYESFVQSEIARLHQLRATVAEARVEAVLARGRAAEAVVDAESMVAEEPLRERRWELLALALYRAGRQGDALRAINRARRTLGEELGLELGPDLRRLEQEVLAQSPSLDWRPSLEHPSQVARRVPLRHTSAVILALASAAAPLATGSRTGASVRPAAACPHGFSLAEMARVVSSFTMSGNDPKHYPDTPFQVLYVEDVEMEMIAGGTLATGTQSFVVPAGTEFFASIFSVTDAPPVLPEFPATAAEAPSYFFDAGKYGGNFEVLVDGRSTTLGPDYLTGPVAVPGDEGTRTLTLAAFLEPLSPGTHVVTVRGGVFGRAVAETYGISFLQEDLTYTVEVLPAD